MKIKTWIIWILLFLLPGLFGWAAVIAHRTYQDYTINISRQIYKNQAEEYLEMYDHWARLSAEEKLENPWGQDPYGGPDIQRKMRANQKERLQASLPELLSGMQIPSEAAEILFGEHWQATVEKYRRGLELREFVALASTVLLISGGAVTLVFVIKLFFSLAQKSKVRSQQQVQVAASHALGKDRAHISQPDKQEAAPLVAAKESESTNDSARDESTDIEEPAPSIAQSLGYFEMPHRQSQTEYTGGPGRGTTITEAGRASLALLEETQTAVDPELESLMTPEPVAKELNELTEQMSAIREYAAEQQNQMRKLQDGYDWLLIKRFCLRIIRCVDNLEDRLETFELKNMDTSILEDIRDELLFALESSGVETFEPELNREYRGLEKYAEAVKERKANDNPERSGMIAEIVRPGYQYLISEDDVKIVRCAQVKLYA